MCDVWCDAVCHGAIVQKLKWQELKLLLSMGSNHMPSHVRYNTLQPIITLDGGRAWDSHLVADCLL